MTRINVALITTMTADEIKDKVVSLTLASMLFSPLKELATDLLNVYIPKINPKEAARIRMVPKIVRILFLFFVEVKTPQFSQITSLGSGARRTLICFPSIFNTSSLIGKPIILLKSIISCYQNEKFYDSKTSISCILV